MDFEDNQECVDLLEARPPRGTGVLSLLDEECLFPKVRWILHTACTTPAFESQLHPLIPSEVSLWQPGPAGVAFSMAQVAPPCCLGSLPETDVNECMSQVYQ